MEPGARMPIHAIWLSTAVHFACLTSVAAFPQQQSLTDQSRALVQARVSFDQAKILLDKAIAKDPNDPEAHHLLGKIHYAWRNYDQAAQEAEKAVSLDGSKSNYHLLLGQAEWARISSVSIFKVVLTAFTSRCCKLVSDQWSILPGSTSRRHRLPRLYASTLSHAQSNNRHRKQKLRLSGRLGAVHGPPSFTARGQIA